MIYHSLHSWLKINAFGHFHVVHNSKNASLIAFQLKPNIFHGKTHSVPTVNFLNYGSIKLVDFMDIINLMLNFGKITGSIEQNYFGALRPPLMSIPDT